MNLFSRAAAFLLLTIAFAASLHGAPITFTPTGTRTFNYTQLSGTFDPITITLLAGTFNTGVITFTLDMSDPAANIIVLNYDTLTVESHTNLLLTSPLLQTLGQPPQKLHVDETGTFTSSPPTRTVGVETLVTYTGVLTGNGIFPAGQLLEGWTYANGKGFEVTATEEGEVDVLGHEIVKEKTEEKIKVQTISDPDGPKLKSPPPQPPPSNNVPPQEIPMQGRGSGESQEKTPGKIPEPSSLLLVLGGLCVGVLRQRRRPE